MELNHEVDVSYPLISYSTINSHDLKEFWKKFELKVWIHPPLTYIAHIKIWRTNDHKNVSNRNDKTAIP